MTHLILVGPFPMLSSSKTDTDEQGAECPGKIQVLPMILMGDL